MAELKRGFNGAKMNKDLDERLVKSGDYREALNVQVSTSDGSDVGSLQTLKGNTELTPGVFPFATGGSRCVGEIVDHKNDDIYWLVAGGLETVNASYKIAKDYIVRYNTQADKLTYVFVDPYKLEVTCSAVNGNNITVASVDSIKEGSHVKYTDNTGAVQNTYVKSIRNAGGNTYPALNATNQQITLGHTPVNVNLNGTVFAIQPSSSQRVLEFSNVTGLKKITGLSIIEGFLAWTDNITEPKKINIQRSIYGTGGVNRLLIGFGDHADFPTRLVTEGPDGRKNVIAQSLSGKCRFSELYNITALKPNPKTPPTMTMSATEEDRTNTAGDVNPTEATTTATNVFENVGGELEPITGQEINLTFAANVDYRIGDIILLTSNPDLAGTNFTEVDVRIEITSITATPPDVLSTTGFVGTVLAVSNSLEVQNGLVFYTRLEQAPPLFEFKFPRFAYRWRYADGEYSTISPWSEVAFLPSELDYSPKKGYNLGMVNTVRALRVKDYVTESTQMPQDVIELDLLYKEDSSPTIYTVKTIKPFDGGGPAAVDGDIWPDGFSWNRDWGNNLIESEIIHAVVPSNQGLRPWDNVPRKALAQEVSANRLIYANYLQNYNLVDSSNTLIKPEVKLSLTGTYESNVVGVPERSIKTMRTYQVGLVYGDRLGRETPVLADKKKGSIYVDKENSCSASQLEVQVLSNPPRWAEYFKLFLKETSNEYYNLAMDRWYDAEDGNIWLSFPSSDRNKVDEDTFLILKKGHDSDSCVKEKARYKILAIENEAPLNIKLDKKIQGVYAGSVGNENEGFPFEDFGFFTIDEDQANTAFDMATIQANSGDMSVYFQIGVNQTAIYDIVSIEQNNSGDYKFTIEGSFGTDVNFLSPAQTWADRQAGINLFILKKEYEDKPEFDGRFFVKIYNDLVVQQYITNSTVSQNYKVTRSLSVGWIHNVANENPAHPSFNSCGFAGLIAPAYGFTDEGLVGITFNGGAVGADNYYLWGDALSTGLVSAGAFGNNGGVPVAGAPSNQGRHQADDGGTEGERFWRDWYVATNNVQCFIDQAWCWAWNGGNADNADDANVKYHKWNGVEAVVDNSVWNMHGGGSANIAINTSAAAWPNGASWTSSSGGWRNGGGGIYQNSIGENILDLSVTGWLPDESAGLNGAAQNQLINFMEAGSGEHYSSDTKKQRHDNTKDFLKDMVVPGCLFRWAQDPAQTVYKVLDSRQTCGIANYKAGNSAQRGQYYEAGARRNRFSFKFEALDGSGQAWDPRSSIAHDGTMETRIEILQPMFDPGEVLSSENPAVFETEPKEAVDVDIYYETSRAYPVNMDTDDGVGSINIQPDEENWFHQRSIVELKTGAAGSAVPAGTYFKFFSGELNPKKIELNLNNNVTLAVGDILRVYTRWNDAVDIHVAAAVAGAQVVEINPFVHNNAIKLAWFNCYSFGNGVESNRIRDDFNKPTIAKGVKASSTIAEPYEEERRGSGFIFSGVYNSVSGLNELNQFIQAEPITKDLNPDYGSIQKLHTRDTNILTMCEDKVLRVLSNKDALYNADGSKNVTASNAVLGDVTPINGNFGISKNPESFATNDNQVFFTDRQRAAVISVEGNSCIPISELGMKDFFIDTFKEIGSDGIFYGSYDKRKAEYNLTMFRNIGKIGNPFMPITVSYGPKQKGWTSFKSFLPQGGVSLNNEYYTFNSASLWKHHSNPIRNNFYGVQFDSYVDILYNDQPKDVKSFNTINYEGTQSKVSQFVTVNVNGVNYSDKEFYNLVAKEGWYIENVTTDIQTGSAAEFKNKEGKWFSVIKGNDNQMTAGNEETLGLETFTGTYALDTSEFSTQGIGMATASSDGTDPAEVMFIIGT